LTAWSRNTAFVNFASINDRFFRGGDAKAHTVAPYGHDGDANLVANDDLPTNFAREHKHALLHVEKTPQEVRMAARGPSTPSSLGLHLRGEFQVDSANANLIRSYERKWQT
jgi:hypothetical protein